METKDIKQLQVENKKLKSKVNMLLEEVQRLRRFEKETKLPNSVYMKRLHETDLRERVFGGTDFTICKGIAEGDSRQFMLYNIEKILEQLQNGEAVPDYVSLIYGKKEPSDIDISFPYVPMEDVDGWLLDLVRLMECLTTHYFRGHSLSLRWLSSRFEADAADDSDQYSPQNEELLHWLEVTEYRRIAALVASKVKWSAAVEYELISTAMYDYIWEELNDIEDGWSNVDECNMCVNRLLDVIKTLNDHIKEGKALGLSIEEIGLIDSLWGDIEHRYQKDYLAATKEIWQKIRPVRDSLADGRRSSKDCDRFVDDMKKIALSIAEKYNLDMEQDDEFSLPLGYLEYWLITIYYNDDSRYQ